MDQIPPSLIHTMLVSDSTSMADLESEIEKLSSVPELKQLAEALVGARKVYNTARAFQAQLCQDETPDTAAPSLDPLAALNIVEDLVLQALPKGYLSEFDKEMAVAMCNAYRSVLEEDSGSALMDRMHSSAEDQALAAFGDVIFAGRSRGRSSKHGQETCQCSADDRKLGDGQRGCARR
jgi:hypothetical protein